MKSTELPALAELRESLREAAARDIAARKPRRWRRRGLAIFAAVLVSGAAAAGAADLISSGSPVDDHQVPDKRYDPTGQSQLAVKAADDPLPWGVKIYTSKTGETCALAGRVRGSAELGLLDAKGTFHPYRAGHSGACGSTTTKQGGYISGTTREGRTVFYGRVRADASSVTMVTSDGDSRTAEVGPGGAFLFVYRGTVTPSSWTVNG